MGVSSISVSAKSEIALPIQIAHHCGFYDWMCVDTFRPFPFVLLTCVVLSLLNEDRSRRYRALRPRRHRLTQDCRQQQQQQREPRHRRERLSEGETLGAPSGERATRGSINSSSAANTLLLLILCSNNNRVVCFCGRQKTKRLAICRVRRAKISCNTCVGVWSSGEEHASCHKWGAEWPKRRNILSPPTKAQAPYVPIWQQSSVYII